MKTAKYLLLICTYLAASSALAVQPHGAGTDADARPAARVSSIELLSVRQQQPLLVLQEGRAALRKSSNAGQTRGGSTIIAAPAGPQLRSRPAKTALDESLSAAFTAALSDALREQGFQVHASEASVPMNDITAPPSLSTTRSDALVYVVVRYAGYKSEDATGVLRPMLGAEVFAFDSSSRAPRYWKKFSVGPQLTMREGMETVSSSVAVAFDGAAALEANAATARDALVQSFRVIATRVATEMPR